MKLFFHLSFGSLRPSRVFTVLVLGAVVSAGCTKSTSSSQSTSPPGSVRPGLLQRWWQAILESRSAAPGSSLLSKQGEEPAVQAEIERLEKLHPAWKMAQAMETSPEMSLQFQALRPGDSQRLGSLEAPSFDVRFSEGAGATPYIAETAGFLPPPVNGEIQLKNDTSAPERLQSLQDEASQRQRRFFADFLREVRNRQQSGRQEYREILESALQERIEVAARRIPETVALVLPDSEMQLEMTNLRLRLLSNLFATPEERRAARERLAELLSQWRAALQEQEMTRAEQLRKLRLEEPARMEAEGKVLLEATLAAIREAQHLSREAAAAEHEKLLEEEFGSKTSRLTPVLPAAPLLQVMVPARGGQGVGVEVEETRSVSEQDSDLPRLAGSTFLRTGSVSLPSKTLQPVTLRSGASLSSDARQRIQALRQLARRDAIRQAKTAARLRSATLQD